MSPVVVKMLTDVYKEGLQRQIEHRRVIEKTDRQGLSVLATAGLLVAAILGSCWTVRSALRMGSQTSSESCWSTRDGCAGRSCKSCASLSHRTLLRIAS